MKNAILPRLLRLASDERVLFALLVLQIIVYWTIATYRAGVTIPVAYQRF